MILFLSLTAKLFLPLIMGDPSCRRSHTHEREIVFVSRCFDARTCCNDAGPIPNPLALNAYDEHVYTITQRFQLGTARAIYFDGPDSKGFGRESDDCAECVQQIQIRLHSRVSAGLALSGLV